MRRIVVGIAVVVAVQLSACEPATNGPGTATPECSRLAGEIEEASKELGEAIRGTPGAPSDEKAVRKARARLAQARAAFEEGDCG